MPNPATLPFFGLRGRFKSLKCPHLQPDRKCRYFAEQMFRDVATVDILCRFRQSTCGRLQNRVLVSLRKPVAATPGKGYWTSRPSSGERKARNGRSGTIPWPGNARLDGERVFCDIEFAHWSAAGGRSLDASHPGPSEQSQ